MCGSLNMLGTILSKGFLISYVLLWFFPYSTFSLSLYSAINPLVVDANFNTNYTIAVNASVVYIFQFNKLGYPVGIPARVTTESYEANNTYPILVVVRQQKSVISWQIPYSIGPEESSARVYKRTSRTLCPEFSSRVVDSGANRTVAHDDNSFIVTISTDNSYNTTVSVFVILEEEFVVSLNDRVSLTVSPAESRYYSFTFDGLTSITSALLSLESDSDICMTLSIQNYSCPVYDQEDNLKYQGYWETVTRKGGMMLTAEQFPERVFIVFVVHSDDWDCTAVEGALPNRNKTVSFTIEPSIGYRDYLTAMIVCILIFAVIYLAAAFLLIVLPKLRRKYNYLNEDVPYDRSSNENSSGDLDEPSASSNIQSRVERRRRVLVLSDLCREDQCVLRTKSDMYLWNLFTVGIFYSLPVVQLVLTYQKTLNQSGNQDLCYYNFLCSHRLGVISDFNHIFSNIGYVLLGFLFLLIVWWRDTSEQRKTTGIPQHYGLYYTLAVALMMEGVLSACYHFCPNHSNFQFDTSFMYILSMISMLKIYQGRHPDINASAYTAFGVLALVIFLGMCGVLNNSPIYYYAFTFLHLVTCFCLSAQIYYMGQWNLDAGTPMRLVSSLSWNRREAEEEEGGRGKCIPWPSYPSRMAILIVGNICNWLLIGCGVYYRLGDFATYLLSILMANLLLYFTFYILMKIICGEKILVQPCIYIGLSILSWVAACSFFYHKTISWKLTPAQSRTYNQPCELLNFYDKHDIWHFLSATSMFFSFMTLLTLDDDLADTDRSQILVF